MLDLPGTRFGFPLRPVSGCLSSTGCTNSSSSSCLGWHGGEFVPVTPFFDYMLVWNTGISYGLLTGLPSAAAADDHGACYWASGLVVGTG